MLVWVHSDHWRTSSHSIGFPMESIEVNIGYQKEGTVPVLLQFRLVPHQTWEEKPKTSGKKQVCISDSK